jgi:hypothetical protein
LPTDLTLVVPIFVFDSKERWFPVGVEESLQAANATIDGHPVDTSALPAAGGRIDFPADMVQPDLPPVGYHRVVRKAGLYWGQWWLWFLYNPKQYVGMGRHEGDFEFVQVASTGPGSGGVLVTCSQHQTGGKRELWACERRRGRPVVYVARDSHANYFQPGTMGLEDVADGKGVVLDDIEWREFGPWAAWPGRWGNSTEQGKSPESPGCQGDRWFRPHIFHSSAR